MKIESEQILTVHNFCFLAGFMLLSIALPLVAINKIYITSSDLILWGIIFLFVARLIRPKSLNTRSDWISILWQQNDVQCVAILNHVHDAMTITVLIVETGLSHQEKIPSNRKSFICVSYSKGIFLFYHTIWHILSYNDI